MKKIAASLMLVCGLVSAQAADLNWLTNMDKALAMAKAEKKTVLVDFTGSDWCSFCIKLDNEVFATQEFADYAKKNLVLVKADFPRRTPLTEEQKKANDALRDKYAKDFQGFPTVVLISAEDKKLGEMVGYGPGTGPKKYIGEIESKLKGS